MQTTAAQDLLLFCNTKKSHLKENSALFYYNLLYQY